MLPEQDLNLAVGRWLAAAPTVTAPRDLHAASMAAVQRRRQFPGGLARLRTGVWPAARPLVRLVAIAAVVGTVLALTALLAVWVGARLRSEDLEQRLQARWPVPFTYAIVGWSAGGRAPGTPDPAQDGWGPDDAAERGVLVGVGPVWGHSDDGRYVLRRDPAGFLEDLRDRSHVPMGPIEPTVVDGRPAMTAAIEPQGWDLHFGERTLGLAGMGYTFRQPSRLIVTAVDGQSVFIQIWTRDRKAFAAWLPTAMRFVDSIRFLQTSSSATPSDRP
jgi:hypothetical protein